MPAALAPDEGMAVSIPVDRGAVDRINDLVLRSVGIHKNLGL
jgi:hypothetical protein